MADDFENMFNKLFIPISEHEDNLKKLNPNYDDLLKMTACLFASCEAFEAECDELKILLDEYIKVFDICSLSLQKNASGLADALLELNAQQKNQILLALIKGVEFEKTRKAKKAALLRHTETYALKKQAIEYWHEHIDPHLSNQKAADILLKIVPVSHRKLVEYVAECKRGNIPPAS